MFYHCHVLLDLLSVFIQHIDLKDPPAWNILILLSEAFMSKQLEFSSTKHHQRRLGQLLEPAETYYLLLNAPLSWTFTSTSFAEL